MGASACSTVKFGAGAGTRVRAQPGRPETGTAAGGDPFGEQPLRTRLKVREHQQGFGIFEIIPDNRGTLEDFYTVDRQVPLGEGSYCSVFRCTSIATKQERAVKIIDRKLLRNTSQIEHEVRVMSVLDHPSIVRLVENFEDARGAQLVMELCSGGELLDVVMDKGAVGETPAAVCLRQMLRAVAYLHRNEIIHRDLKAENWLLAQAGPLERVALKLADFGLARSLGPHDIAKTKCGTPYYVAPEVVMGRYGSKADLWSCGVVLHMLLVGKVPFDGNNTEEVLKSIATVMVHRRLNESLRGRSSQPSIDLLEALLERDTTKRLSAGLALQDAWFSKALPPSKDGGPTASLGLHDPKAFAVLERLRNVGELAHLEMAVLGAAALQLAPEDVRDVDQTFNGLDADGTGMITVSELAEGLRTAGLQLDDQEATELMGRVDADRSGAVDYSEFLVASMDAATLLSREVCWKAFKLLDTRNHGVLERPEFARVLGGVALEVAGGNRQEEIATFLRRYDSNSDGQICFEEFEQALRSRILSRLRP